MGSERKLLTYQTVQRYEAALLRHAQFCRWMKVYICPCVTTGTNQPDIHCPVCKGRGEIYKSPGPFKIIDELAPHDEFGRFTIKNKNYIPGTVVAWRTSRSGAHVTIPLAVSQPADKSYIQMEYPWLHAYERIYVNYHFDPNITLSKGNGKMVRSDYPTIVPDALKVEFKGREYHGSISSVTKVYNKTTDYTYIVTGFAKENIYIQNAGDGNPSDGDVLEIDCVYQSPYPFLVHSVSTKLRYEAAYIIDQADAVVQSAYYYDIGPNDLITALAMEIPGYSIVEPTVAGPGYPDSISDVFDIARLTGIVDATGKEYNIYTDVQLVGRNEIVWLVTKPIIRYTVKYMYNPTFVGLTTYDTSRFSENKAFVNRLNAMIRDRMTKEITF
jgi:hypothetical protein